MSKVARLFFDWTQVSPVHSGYGQTLAQATGKIERGARKSAQLETHSGPEGTLGPALLASSVKGVFRSASAWLVERAASELGPAATYATCDYQSAVPQSWRARIQIPRVADGAFCPICRVYGGAGCMAAVRGGSEEKLRRQLSRVRFSFGSVDDALHGSAAWGAKQTFAWEKASGKRGQLEIENFTPDANARLEVRVDDADDFALALIALSADLIGSGLFRFGRFVSRGYGAVRLTPDGGEETDLYALLRGQSPAQRQLPGLEEMQRAVRDTVQLWLSSWKRQDA